MKNVTNPRVPWSGRGMTYTEAEIATVVQAMKDADPLTQGRYQRSFEAGFAAYIGAEHCFAVTHCTAALELAAILSGVGPDDEVILPAHTFIATALPFARSGARLVWADIDRDTRLVTASTLAPLVTERTRVIIVVHLYGLAADMDPIMDLARRHGIIVVEDVAQSAGARYRGARAGAIGDFGCFSFHSHKNISTLGEGGMLVVKDPGLAAKVPGLRHNGGRGFDDQDAYWKPAMSNVDFDIEGVWPHNFCIGEVQCALGAKLLERLDDVNRDRRARARRFMTALEDFPELVFQSAPEGCEHTHHLLAARYDGQAHGRHRDDLIELMAFTYGVKLVVQYYPLNRYPLMVKAGFGAASCPNTDEFFDNMVSFPFQFWMPEDQFEFMIDATRKALTELRQGSG